MCRLRLFAALAIGLLAACGSPAQSQQSAWQVADAGNGYRVAKVASTGAILSMGLVCDRTVPLLALRLARAPARNPALLSLTNGTATGKFAIARNGATDTWAGPIRDARVLDMLAREASIEVGVDGVRYGTVSLAGAGAAMRSALAGCWVGGGNSSAGTAAPPATQPTSFDNKPMAIADTTSPVTAQTSFPTRDPKTGKPRLPVKLGAWIPTGTTCSRPNELIFIDSGDGAYAFPHQNAESIIEAIRMTKAGTYVTREEVAAGDTATSSATYTITDPEHFSIVRSGEKPQRYSYCAQAALPIERRHFLASEARPIAALPVRAGYYSTGQMGEGKQSTRCVDLCGYALVTPAGIATAYKCEGCTDAPNGISRQSRKFTSVMQEAPREYVSEGASDEGSGVFTVHSAEAFSEYEYSGDITYRFLDPSRIPANMMPRF